MIKKYFQSILLFVATGTILSLISCNPSAKLEKAEKESISNYLAGNSNLNYELKPSGLYYLEVQTGTGRTPVAHDTVYVIYTGKFLDGSVFTSNVGKDIYVFPFGEEYNILGFEEGISYMKEGGKSSLLLPSKLAYGPTGRTPIIQGYTALLYDVELVKVKPGPGK
jgi:FKBP-type peptidyl-prolyl cis-trans isomerase FkpA